jgi:hypothetical protein
MTCSQCTLTFSTSGSARVRCALLLVVHTLVWAHIARLRCELLELLVIEVQVVLLLLKHTTCQRLHPSFCNLHAYKIILAKMSSLSGTCSVQHKTYLPA